MLCFCKHGDHCIEGLQEIYKKHNKWTYSMKISFHQSNILYKCNFLIHSRISHKKVSNVRRDCWSKVSLKILKIQENPTMQIQRNLNFGQGIRMLQMMVWLMQEWSIDLNPHYHYKDQTKM